MAEQEVSHGDIYRALGILEGKLDAMNTALMQKREDVNLAFERIRQVETTMSKVVGACLVLSIIWPLAVTAVSPRLHFGPEHPVEARPR